MVLPRKVLPKVFPTVVLLMKVLPLLFWLVVLPNRCQFQKPLKALT
jgi:hypothetical protein